MNKRMTDSEQHWKILVLLLKKIAAEKGITHQVIANHSGLAAPNITRVFSLKYCPTLRVFLSIANAVGVNFFFEDKEGKTSLSEMFEQAMTELGRRENRFDKN